MLEDWDHTCKLPMNADKSRRFWFGIKFQLKDVTKWIFLSPTLLPCWTARLISLPSSSPTKPKMLTSARCVPHWECRHDLSFPHLKSLVLKYFRFSEYLHIHRFGMQPQVKIQISFIFPIQFGHIALRKLNTTHSGNQQFATCYISEIFHLCYHVAVSVSDFEAFQILDFWIRHA